MSFLVIVESPAKAKTIGKILGSDYVVMSSVGHISDLPAHSLGIDISADGKVFSPRYEVSADKTKVVDGLVKAAKGAQAVYLASDPDREGEAIAWHLNNVLHDRLGRAAASKPFYRIEYNEITASAVSKAIASPHEIDQARVNSQQARRLLDRIVGWKVSPLLSRLGIHAHSGARGKQVGLSAGRVQSVALRMVCERERSIMDFVPTPYWEFLVYLHKNSGSNATFIARLQRINSKKVEVHDEVSANAVAEFLSGAQYSVADITTKPKKRNPYPPFTTSSMQQAASNVLGLSPDATMRCAQVLYEAGLITYMRTDSVRIADDALAYAESFIKDHFGTEYSQRRVFRGKNGIQDAHEAIRPTDCRLMPSSEILDRLPTGADQRCASLYDLVWRRFLASQMPPAVYDTMSVRFFAQHALGVSAGMLVSGEPIEIATLTASTYKLSFDGWLAVQNHRDSYNPNNEEIDEEKGGETRDSDTQDFLPSLESGESLGLERAQSVRKETKPPARYNEATLVKALEANGIGRPSTYASVVKTLKDRSYVISRNKVLSPTETGTKVEAYLVPHFPELFDIQFTAKMEQRLDDVEDRSKQLDWQGMLAEFYEKFKIWIKEAKGPAADTDKVIDVLVKFSSITKWAAPRRVGKRVFSDRKFVQDIANTFTGNERVRVSGSEDGSIVFDPSAAGAGPVSESQLSALYKLLLRYREQVPDAEQFVRDAGYGNLAEDNSLQPPDDRSVEIVRILDSIGGPEPTDVKFYSSLADQIRGGKRLSDKQQYYLGEIFLSARSRIPDFSQELCDKLGITLHDEPQVDMERLQAVVGALATVTEWNPPVKRGKRVYNDSEFFTSVYQQFQTKGKLSEPQCKALEKMLVRYSSKALGAAQIIEKYGMKTSSRESK